MRATDDFVNIFPNTDETPPASSASKLNKRPSPHTNDYPEAIKRKGDSKHKTKADNQSKTPSPTASTDDPNTNTTSGETISSSSQTNASTTPTTSPESDTKNGARRKTDSESTTATKSTFSDVSQRMSPIDSDWSPPPTANPSTAPNRNQSPDRDSAEYRSKMQLCETIKPNASILDLSFVDHFSPEWQIPVVGPASAQPQQFLSDTVQLYTEPFSLCVMQNFLNDPRCVFEIEREMCTMEWHRKQMDLYEFHQTTDLANISMAKQPMLRSFYNMLTREMLPWMREATNLPLSKISASCSMYNNGDFLLVHDDLLSDRQIAFVYYVSPYQEKWADHMGGALELFECDPSTDQPKYPIVRQIKPVNNQFIFFQVSHKSFHQVAEVTGNVYPRLTINGWFHGEPQIDTRGIIYSDIEYLKQMPPYQGPSDDDINLTEWITNTYLKSTTKSCIQRHIEQRSEASLESFLIQEFYDVLVAEFKDNDELRWELEGPANQRKFESLRLDANSTSPPMDLLNLFRSQQMFELLHEYTELDFDGRAAQEPTCSIQICRFTQGCYTLLGDSSTFTENALDVILFFNATKKVGKITYLSPNEFANGSETSLDFERSMEESRMRRNQLLLSASNTSVASRSTTDNRNRSKESDRTQSTDDKPSTTSAAAAKAAAKAAATKKNGGDGNASDGSSDTSGVGEGPVQRQTATWRHYSDGSDSDVEYLSCGGESQAEELAHEDALLTIYPKNNSMNLVYRTSGQAKFVKYISKSSLAEDEYLYIMIATYKE